MTFQEKKSLVLISVTLTVLIAFVISHLNQVRMGELTMEDRGTWALSILAYCGVMVVANILVLILFHILSAIGMTIGVSVRKEIGTEDQKAYLDNLMDVEFKEDERDRSISLFAEKVSGIYLGLVILGAFILGAFEMSIGLILSELFVGAMATSIIKEIMAIKYYRLGIPLRK